MNVSEKFTLILSACIRPGSEMTRHIQRIQPELRLEDYRKALTFWLQLGDPRIAQIIFIDNSGYPLEELQRHAESKNSAHIPCEFISLPHMPLPEGLHYGYLEFKLMDEGLAKSSLYGKTPYLVKATGRYVFPAITRLLNSLPDSFEVAVDSRDNERFTRWPRHFTTAAMLLFKTEYYERELRRIYLQMRPAPPMRHQFIEDMLFDKLISLRGKKSFVLRWPVNCDPSGVGSSGDSYTTFRKRIISLCRGMGRKLIPEWWF